MAQAERFAALALLEFENVPIGVAATDDMVKRAPIALLRCGTVHPGRFLTLVGGSVASTEEAHRAGVDRGCDTDALLDAVLLPEVHPGLHDAILGKRLAPESEALGVVETRVCPALLRALDAAVKETHIDICEVRLADDLGGRAIGLLSGLLTYVETALEVCREKVEQIETAVMPRLDPALRELLGKGTLFGSCAAFEPEGAEHPEEVTCSWDG